MGNMTTTTTSTAGSIVTLIGDNLGTIRHPNDSRFTDIVVGVGWVGTYEGPHPNPELADWHLIAIEAHDGTVYAPLHRSMFEVMELAHDE